MSSTLLEQTRGFHEDVERLERQIVREFKEDVKGHKERLTQGHRVRSMLLQIQQRAQQLERIYADQDGARKEEIAALAGADPLQTFQTRMREIREYHRRYPLLDVSLGESEEALRPADPRIEFSGEEAGGRCLDLHDLFHRYSNSKFGEKLEYPDYVSSVTDFSKVQAAHRSSQPYREYLRAVLAYLESFHQRTQPLTPLEKLYARLSDFDARWEEGQVPGWEGKGAGGTQTPTPLIDVDAFEGVEELETIGADRLKEALASLGLKSGGTLRQRAERLYLLKDTPLQKLDRKLFVKGTAVPSLQNPVAAAKLEAAAKEAALLEAKVAAIMGELPTVIADTRANVEKKQALTYEELQAEAAEAEADAAGPSDSDEEDEFVYNPLKLPLGYDGKPIPYWLYKLHGLNQEFKCEICGDVKYRGRREFERHFKEFRHQQGMRALGIPNNKNFYEVTQIAEAQALWANIKEREGLRLLPRALLRCSEAHHKGLWTYVDLLQAECEQLFDFCRADEEPTSALKAVLDNLALIKTTQDWRTFNNSKEDDPLEPFPRYCCDWSDKTDILAAYATHMAAGGEALTSTMEDWTDSLWFVALAAALSGIKRPVTRLELNCQPRLIQKSPKAFALHCNDLRLSMQVTLGEQRLKQQLLLYGWLLSVLEPDMQCELRGTVWSHSQYGRPDRLYAPYSWF
ncbi:hypothetical protein WJX73_006772 [Symbiochloris irregularis]|uniref:Splicing factor 3A subunit 3 n=1 Tax=Symbiochloris irregularis TaxID=706552 RepID=A0AAW1Q2S9_9CHLO